MNYFNVLFRFDSSLHLMIVAKLSLYSPFLVFQDPEMGKFRRVTALIFLIIIQEFESVNSVLYGPV